MDLIDFYLSNTDAGLEMTEGQLRLFAGDPGFANLLAQLEGLRFHRPPTNLLILALPLLSEWCSSRQKALNPADITHLYITLAQDGGQKRWRSEELSLWVDEWTCRDFDRGLSLPLVLAGGREASQSLAQSLWELAASDA